MERLKEKCHLQICSKSAVCKPMSEMGNVELENAAMHQDQTILFLETYCQSSLQIQLQGILHYFSRNHSIHHSATFFQYQKKQLPQSHFIYLAKD